MATRKVYILLFFLIILNKIIGENVSDYSLQLIQKIAVGGNEEELGFELPIAGSPSSPYTFIISNKNEIFIPDIINNRINIYDLSLKNVKTLKNINDCRYARKMEVDAIGNIYCLVGGETGLIKIDTEGKLIFQIDRYSLPKNVYKNKNYFVIDNELFFYDDDNKIKMIDEKGKIKDNSFAKQKIDELSKLRHKLSSYKDIQELGVSKTNVDLFTKIKNESESLFIADCFYNADFYKTKEYFDKIEPIRKEIEIIKKANMVNKKTDIKLELNDFSGLTLSGYDKDHNSYWESSKLNDCRSKQIIIIYSKYGELIDAFYYGEYKRQGMEGLPDRSIYPTSGAKIAVSWVGDLYFICVPLIKSESTESGTFDIKIIGEKAYYFYKIERQW